MTRLNNTVVVSFRLRTTSLPALTPGVEFIIHPIRHVVFDIIRNAVHFWSVADDVVVETGLPGEIDLFFVGVFCDGRFETSYGERQSILLT